MKKLPIAILFLLSFFITHAQSKLGYGIKAGGNATTISGDNTQDADPRFSFHGGVFINIRIAERYALQPEVLYAGQGWKGSGGKTNLSYINIPVMLQLRTPSGFYAETGPQVGFLTSAKLKSSGNSTNVKDNFKSTDFSWAAGLGYTTSINLGFNLRYTFGLSKVSDASSADGRNSALLLGVSYTFVCKKRK